MGVYQIETDQGTYEVTTEEPSNTHPDLPPVGGTKSLAESAVSAITPEPQASGGFLSRLAQGTKEMFVPSMDSVKRLFNPNAGQFGPSRVLEQAGQQVGQAVRGAAQNTAEQLATSKFGQNNPNLSAGLGAAYGTAADVASNSLTPSSFQQQLGAEGVGVAAQPVKEGIANILDQASISPARRATGFMKPDLRSTQSPFETIRKTAQANAAGKEMLDRGAIPLLGSPGTMQDNALQILAEGRNKVNGVIDALDQAGQNIPTPELGKKIADSIKAKFPDEIKAVNSVINDLESINPQSISPGSLAELKQRWGKFGFQDKTVGTTVADVYRKAYKAVDQVLKSHIESVAPDLLPQYVQGMKTQETAMTALRGITNKGARMAANMPVSLPTMIAGAGDIASGNLGGAAAKIGATQAAINSGAALTANTLKGASNLVRSEASPGFLSYLISAIRKNQSPAQSQEPIQQNPSAIDGIMSRVVAPASTNASAEPVFTKDMVAYRTGLEQFLRHNNQGAIKAWQKALKLNPGLEEADRGLERLAMKEGKNKNFYKPK